MFLCISTFEELISNRLNVEELKEYIEADSLAFISENGLYESVYNYKLDSKKCGLCMACFNGIFPTQLYEAFDRANKEEK